MAPVNIYDTFSAPAFNAAAKKIPVAKDAPVYDPVKVNPDGNCYSYILDMGFSTRLNPGQLGMSPEEFAAFKKKFLPAKPLQDMTGQEYHEGYIPHCESLLKEGARRDGLIEVMTPIEDIVFPKGYSPVAMVMRCCLLNEHPDPDMRDWDYHWYRQDQDNDGSWSCKMGGEGGDILRRDKSGNIIHDPRTADRGWYTRFSGFFLAPRPGRP